MVDRTTDEQRHDLAVLPPSELKLMWSGEIVDLENEPERIPQLVRELRELRAHVNDAIGFVTEHVARMSLTAGTKTIALGGSKVRLTGDTEVHWDVQVLEELLEAGLPQERYAELVTEEISYKVNASVANQIKSSNPAYREIVERARTVLPHRPSLKVE